MPQKPSSLLIQLAQDCGIRDADKLTIGQIRGEHAVSRNPEYAQFDLRLEAQIKKELAMDKRTPTSPQDQERINSMCDVLGDTVMNLASRWLDEHEYEDIEEYRKVLEPMLPDWIKLVKMTKRPFGFTFTLGTMPGAEYAVYCTTRQYGWKRTK